MGRFADAAVAGLTAVITLAIIATLVSKNANTSQVITSSGNALSGVIKSATSPYSGGGLTSLQPISDVSFGAY